MPAIAFSKTYIYSSNDVNLKVSVYYKDSTMDISYTICNLGSEVLYYSGNCLITEYLSNVIYLDFGAILTSRYISDVPITLHKLSANDSVTFYQKQKIKNLYSKIQVNFDCIRPSKLTKSRARKLNSLLTSLDAQKTIFKVDYADYLEYYDWFTIEIPALY